MKFRISGMTCAACSSHVEKAVSELPGVNDVSVSLLTDSMTLSVSDELTSERDIIAAVTKAGYVASSFNGTKVESVSAGSESDSSLKRVVLSALITLPLFYLSMSGMLGLPLPNFLVGTENCLVLALLEALLSCSVIFINFRCFAVGFGTLFRLAPTMDSLVALGSSASFVYGLIKLFVASKYAGTGDITAASDILSALYFESSAVILTLISLGKYFELKSRKKTCAALNKLMSLSPDTAIVSDGEQTFEIKVSDIKVGNRILLRPGMKAPVDGIIVSGNGVFDESAISGESIPVDKTVGDLVISASALLNGSVIFEATAVGENTTLNKIIKTVEEAGASKAPIARFADKVAEYFVPAVIIISVLTGLIWLACGAEPDFALNMAISVLVISCPCSLGLATPVSVMVASGKGAELGILFRNAESLEITGKTDTVVLDKTGTVTEGKPVVTDVIPANNTDETTLLEYAYSIESESEHPFAEAIRKYAILKGINLKSTDSFKSIFGKGATVQIEGLDCYAGNAVLMQEIGVDICESLNTVRKLAEDGITPLFFAVGARFIGIIAVSDIPKTTSKEAVSGFKKIGISVSILTGDNEITAKSIANSVGVENYFAGVLPNDKADTVKTLQSKNKTVAMIGDGINDAPALATADVGIAVGNGNGIAVDSADVVLIRNDLRSAVTAISLSKTALRNIKENLFWALIYNSIGIPLAAGVLYPHFGISLSPVIAAAAMSLSSICVVSNALRLRLFKDPYPTEITDARRTKTVYIAGMMCEHCVAHVKEALEPFGSVTVDLSKGTAEIVTNTDDSLLREAIAEAGYEVTDIK